MGIVTCANHEPCLLVTRRVLEEVQVGFVVEACLPEPVFWILWEPMMRQTSSWLAQVPGTDPGYNNQWKPIFWINQSLKPISNTFG